MLHKKYSWINNNEHASQIPTSDMIIEMKIWFWQKWKVKMEFNEMHLETGIDIDWQKWNQNEKTKFYSVDMWMSEYMHIQDQ